MGPLLLTMVAAMLPGLPSGDVPPGSTGPGAAQEVGASPESGQQGPSRAELMAIARELAEAIGQRVVLETRELASGEGLAVALGVGDVAGGHALVIGDFTSPTVDGLETRTREAALVARALLLGGAGTRLRAEGCGVVLLLGATAPAPSQGVTGQARVAVFDRNFPVPSWGDARRLDPAGAGPYPCSRADVAATVDWVVKESGCFGVLDLRAGASQGRGGPPAGSLAAFCRSEVRIPLAAAAVRAGPGILQEDAVRGPVRALGSLIDARTHVVIEDSVLRRAGVGAWVVDLTLSVRGSGAADFAAIELELASTGIGADGWVGAAEAVEVDAPFDVIKLKGASGILAPARPGQGRVLRLFVHRVGTVSGAPAPRVQLTLSAPRCRSTVHFVDLAPK